MSLDPRTTPVRGGRASRALEGLVKAETFLSSRLMTVQTPTAAVRKAPDAQAEQIDQLLFGEGFEALEEEGGHLWGQSRRDGYVGFVEADALAAPGPSPTCRVSAARTYAFAQPDFKAAASGPYPLNALVAIEGREGDFVKAVGAGWMFEAHLSPIGTFETDPVAVAERFLGAPYVWGGRDGLGMDCSGLVQQALFACGRACPRDADQQAELGRAIERKDLRRGDLVFWPGHVAWAVDSASVLHADGRRMLVVIEDLDAAAWRRSGAELGPVAYRRLEQPLS